jgi:E3 ubiquitin-protein ligase SIAH1
MTCLGCSEAVEYDCSVCGESADIRCHAVEKILGGMTTRCSFSEHGCTAIIPFMEKLSHEAFCLHAPCYCPIAGCRPYVRKPLRDHLSMEHPGLQLSGVIAGDLYPMRIGEGESAHVVSLFGTGAAFLLVVDRSVPLAGYTLSVIHLASEPAPGQHDFKYKIQVSTRVGIICLSGKTQSVGCLRSPYQPCASMFVEEDIWDPEYSPVYIELR